MSDRWQRLYAQWPWSDAALTALGIVLAHNVTWYLGNGLLYLCHRNKWFSKYKIQPSREPDPELVRKTFYRELIEHWVTIPLVSYLLARAKILKLNLRSPLPSAWTFLYHYVIWFLIADFLFFWIHRALHTKRLYGMIHKQHHEYNVSIGIAAEYAHPVEAFFANFLPTSAGPILFYNSAHAVEVWSYLVIRLWETIDAHSGYSFPWSPWKLLPFQGGPDRHDFHHSHNVGNYGMLAFWDWICGTDKAYREWKAKQEEKQSKKLVPD